MANDYKVLKSINQKNLKYENDINDDDSSMLYGSSQS